MKKLSSFTTFNYRRLDLNRFHKNVNEFIQIYSVEFSLFVRYILNSNI